MSLCLHSHGGANFSNNSANFFLKSFLGNLLASLEYTLVKLNVNRVGDTGHIEGHPAVARGRCIRGRSVSGAAGCLAATACRSRAERRGQGRSLPATDPDQAPLAGSGTCAISQPGGPVRGLKNRQPTSRQDRARALALSLEASAL